MVTVPSILYPGVSPSPSPLKPRQTPPEAKRLRRALDLAVHGGFSAVTIRWSQPVGTENGKRFQAFQGLVGWLVKGDGFHSSQTNILNPQSWKGLVFWWFFFTKGGDVFKFRLEKFFRVCCIGFDLWDGKVVFGLKVERVEIFVGWCLVGPLGMRNSGDSCNLFFQGGSSRWKNRINRIFVGFKTECWSAKWCVYGVWRTFDYSYVVVSNIFIFIPTWGNDPIWLIFFRWVETTN